MNIRTNRLFWGIVFLLLILSGPFTVVLSTGFRDLFSVNGLLRASGTIAFTLLFTQIVLGSRMNKFTQILGSKAYRVHALLGITGLVLIFVHPLFYSLQTYIFTENFTPFLLPASFTRSEFWISMGRVGFLILFSSILIARFRTFSRFRRIWKNVHYLNYVAFYFIAVHAWFTGTDTWHMPFVAMYWLYVVVVSIVVVRKVQMTYFPLLFRNENKSDIQASGNK